MARGAKVQHIRLRQKQVGQVGGIVNGESFGYVAEDYSGSCGDFSHYVVIDQSTFLQRLP